MGELTPGMKDRLKKLVDESNTDEAYLLLQAINESDLDVPGRVVVDFDKPTWSWIEDKAATINSSPATLVQFLIKTTRDGERAAIAAHLMGTAPKVGTGQRKR